MSIKSDSPEFVLPALTQDTDSENFVFVRQTQLQLAWADIVSGIKQWRIWFMLAYQDIKLRYRRSLLGPLWLTLSMAITVYSMGFLYSHILHVPIAEYFPFLVAGMLSWSLISTCVTDLTEGFAASDGLIKQIKLPYTLHLHRIACRNILIFFHNLLVIVPVLLIYHSNAKVNLNTLLVIPGLLISYINAITFGVIVAMIGARYRDISQIIKNLVQVVFFITPVMWVPNALGSRVYILDANPFYAFIEIIRQPLLGHTPTLKNLIMVGVVTIIGFIFSFLMLKRYRSRIVYWL